MLDNQAVGAWSTASGRRAAPALLKARARSRSGARRHGSARRCASSARRCSRTPRLKAAINQFARRAAVGVVASYGAASSSWSRKRSRLGRATVTDRLEGAVGRDLQYIRINGTLVGGLVGLVAPRVDSAEGDPRSAPKGATPIAGLIVRSAMRSRRRRAGSARLFGRPDVLVAERGVDRRAHHATMIVLHRPRRSAGSR